jgi:hypothetical protein
MTSTNPPDPPNFNGINYNSSFWTNSTTTTGLSYNDALKSFLSFPIAQGPETLQNTTVNGTLTLVNTSNPSETYSQYIDTSSILDMTLSTAQTTGGLTIRTPDASFTMNPNLFNVNLVTPSNVSGVLLLNPINMNNNSIISMGQYSTAYTQVNNTNLDYIATCNYVNNMIVNGDGILDNNNVWTGTNTFNIIVTLPTQGEYSIVATYGNTAATQAFVQSAINSVTGGGYASLTATQTFSGNNTFSNSITTPSITFSTFGTLTGSSTGLTNSTVLNLPSQTTYTQSTPYGNIASTQAFVQSAINSIITGGGYALLSSPTLQTFTGPISFTSATIPQINSVNIATVPITTTLTINGYVGANSNSSIISGTTQYSLSNNSIISFLSYAFTFSINTTPVGGAATCTVQFNIKPWSAYPPPNQVGNINIFCNNNSVMYNGIYNWSTSYSGPPYLLYITAPAGAPITGGSVPAITYTVNLASIGTFFA